MLLLRCFLFFMLVFLNQKFYLLQTETYMLDDDVKPGHVRIRNPTCEEVSSFKLKIENLNAEVIN